MNLKTKKQIDFARTYRHLEINKLETSLYLLFFVLPFLILLLFFYTEITYVITWLAQFVLKDYIPANQIQMGIGQLLPFFGEVFYINIPTTSPDLTFTYTNLFISFCVFVIFLTGKRAGKPLSIYVIIATLTHISSCVYFVFLSENFPYTASEYSELYIKQEVSIWISFLVISGLLTGILGFQGYARRMLTMISIMAYSIVFGMIRYLLFMFVIYQFSALYIPVLFFLLGPLFDFLYFVFFYGIYIDKSIKRYDSEKGRGQWKWA